ncbi:MAG: glycosyltransferase family 39 protein, partial [Actinobacteria bacterium]|nr:glycosyltransferase family 39 protein [Actinomycetota bacterium]
MRKAVSVTRGVLDFIKGERITGWQNIYLTVLQHNHPPLEFLLIIPAVPFKNRELIARIIYLSLNILFLIISYFISKKVINNKFALYLLAILSTSTYFIWTSRFVTHDSISIIVSTLIGLAIIYFYKTNNLKKALFFLFLCLTIGLYSFIDFVLYLPIITLILYDRLKSNGVKPYLRPIVIFLIINCLFYVPYVFYSFIPNVPQSAGFNYYLNSKSNVLSLNLLKNLGIFYKDFFSKSGVFSN